MTASTPLPTITSTIKRGRRFALNPGYKEFAPRATAGQLQPGDSLDALRAAPAHGARLSRHRRAAPAGHPPARDAPTAVRGESRRRQFGQRRGGGRRHGRDAGGRAKVGNRKKFLRVGVSVLAALGGGARGGVGRVLALPACLPAGLLAGCRAGLMARGRAGASGPGELAGTEGRTCTHADHGGAAALGQD